MYQRWPIVILVALVVAVVVIALLLSGCHDSFLRVFSPTDPNKVVAEAKGVAANTLASQLSKEREINQKMSATAQQVTTRFCYMLYGTGVLFIIGGIVLAWTYNQKTGIGISFTGVVLFVLSRMLQQYIAILTIATLVLLVVMAGWYIWKFHDTIFKLTQTKKVNK